MVNTAAKDALNEWLATTRTSLAELSRRVGVTPAAVSYWIAGVSRPEVHHRMALEMVTGVSWRLWFTEEEAARARGELPAKTPSGQRRAVIVEQSDASDVASDDDLVTPLTTGSSEVQK